MAFQDMHCVVFAENALFKASLLVGDKREIHFKKSTSVYRCSNGSYNLTAGHCRLSTMLLGFSFLACVRSADLAYIWYYYRTLAKEGPLWNVGPPPLRAQFSC
jgi:hypothetical protein